MKNFIYKVLRLGVTCLAITTLVLATNITLIGLHIGGII